MGAGISTYGLGHCQSPARCWTFPPPDGFPREPRGPLGGKPPLSPPRPPMRPMGPPGPPGPPGPAVRKQRITSLGTALCPCGPSLQLEDRSPHTCEGPKQKKQKAAQGLTPSSMVPRAPSLPDQSSPPRLLLSVLNTSIDSTHLSVSLRGQLSL